MQNQPSASTGRPAPNFTPNPAVSGPPPTPTYTSWRQMPPPPPPNQSTGPRMSRASLFRTQQRQQSNEDLAAVRPQPVPLGVPVLAQQPQYDDQGALINPPENAPPAAEPPQNRSIFRTNTPQERNRQERRGPLEQSARGHNRFFKRYGIKSTILKPFFPLTFYPVRYTLLGVFNRQGGTNTALAAQDILLMGDGYIFGMTQYILRL
ncbi:uncharacterized protein LOC135848394 [Planococcus citri]|uniref:uncharacterized protein LOC135848394 n=1 Tax=Planococcus citri TaxID=170843 RepID=UPI0031F7CD00